MPVSHAERQRRYRQRTKLLDNSQRFASRYVTRDELLSIIMGLKEEIALLRDEVRDASQKSHGVTRDILLTPSLKTLPSEENLYKKEIDSFVPKPRKKRVESKAFERFWEAYPHRGSLGDPRKPAADKFATKVKAGADPEAIIVGAERYAAHVTQHEIDPQYVPQAVKWLNQEYWNNAFSNGHDISVAKRISDSQIEDIKREIRESLRNREEQELPL